MKSSSRVLPIVIWIYMCICFSQKLGLTGPITNTLVYNALQEIQLQPSGLKQVLYLLEKLRYNHRHMHICIPVKSNSVKTLFLKTWGITAGG